YGVQRYNYGGLTVRAIDMLGALSGNIGVAGGGVNYANKVYGDHVNWDSVAPAIKPEHRYLSKPKLATDLLQLKNPEVKAIFISRSNPAVQVPNTVAAVETIKSIEFKVVLDHFMTDTAVLADIVLPVTYFMEETDIMYSSMWNGYIFYNEKLVNNGFEAKSELEIYSLLAEKMGLTDFPQMSVQQWISKLFENTTEIDLILDALKSNTYTYAKSVKSIPWEDYRFKTPSGKYEFVGAEALEQYMEAQNDKERYCFKLLTVHARESLHSQHFMDSDREYPEVYISKEDVDLIELMKLKDGELIKLENQYGSIKAELSFSDKVQKGVLYMKEGWWYKNGGSVNDLTPHEVSDIGNQATYNECRCNIVKLGVSDE
ncbi:MAG TPA: molybdopterin dinucleotide binding domain-containing protein, partial [Patescibacteria group bacterium]|nr:molybdopterin dinucleotide binding domain-containing protein [Patescibacteria group bacterium]